MSCSDDWSCKIWTQNSATPLFNFDLQSSVGEIAWSTFSSAAFTAATAEGKVFLLTTNEIFWFHVFRNFSWRDRGIKVRMLEDRKSQSKFEIFKVEKDKLKLKRTF